jgi:hypothetical protein
MRYEAVPVLRLKAMQLILPRLRSQLLLMLRATESLSLELAISAPLS